MPRTEGEPKKKLPLVRDEPFHLATTIHDESRRLGLTEEQISNASGDGFDDEDDLERQHRLLERRKKALGAKEKE